MKIQRDIVYNSNDPNSSPKKPIEIEHLGKKVIQPSTPQNCAPTQNPENRYASGLKEALNANRKEGQSDISQLGQVEGTEEAVKKSVSETQINKEKLTNLLNNTNVILWRCK